MKSKIYLEAAKKIASGSETFCCNALNRLSSGDWSRPSKAAKKFNRVFEPRIGPYVYFSFEENLVKLDRRDRARLSRTLALLLMQEIEDCGGL